MEVSVDKENICVNRLVIQKKELFFVQNDLIVPDAKPDILKSINVSGNLCIYKKEIFEDKIKVDGGIYTYIMYLPDSKNDNLRAINCVLDFSETINVSGIRENMDLKIKPIIKDLECKVINGRKISVKAGVELSLKVYSNETIEVINTINNIDDIQVLSQDFDINSLVGNGKTIVYAKDTLSIPEKDELAEILKVENTLTNEDIKISYNKVLTKAEFNINIMYLTEDNRIERINGRIPIVGFIDIQNIAENNICDVNYEIKNIIIKPESASEHSIYVEYEIEVTCIAYEKKQIKLIQDLYSPKLNLEYTMKKILTPSNREENVLKHSINNKIQIPELNEAQIIDIETNVNLNKIDISDNKIYYSGEVSLNVIFQKNNIINTKNTKIPFETTTDNTFNTEKINLESNLYIENSDFNVKLDGNLECNIEILIKSIINNNITMNLIDDIDAEDEPIKDDYNSLILYIVNTGDTLWKIAKKFNSTIEDIKRINNIQDENKIYVGQRIYIPKFNYIRKEVKQDGKTAVNI